MRCTGKKTFYPSELASAERRLLKTNAIKMKNELLEKISFISVCFHLFLTSSLSLIEENLNATATHPASCQEYFDRGETRNGTYTIKPTLDKHSFKVSCEFANSKGYTIIKPTNLNDTGNVYPPSHNLRCEEENCFTQSVDYNLDVEQIKVFMSFEEFKIY